MIAECVGAGAATVVAATRPDDLVVPAYVDVLREDGVPVEAVAEDLGRGYGNGTPLLTLRNRLAAEESFGVAFGDDVLLGGHDLAAMRDMASNSADAVIAAQRPDPATEPLAVVSRLILRPSIFDLLVPTEHARGEVDLAWRSATSPRIADVRVHRITGCWVTVGEPRRYVEALQTYWQLQTELAAHH